MKIGSGIALVTGSSGTIGSAVMRRFAGVFDSIVGFDRKAPKPPPPGRQQRRSRSEAAARKRGA